MWPAQGPEAAQPEVSPTQARVVGLADRAMAHGAAGMAADMARHCSSVGGSYGGDMDVADDAWSEVTAADEVDTEALRLARGVWDGIDADAPAAPDSAHATVDISYGMEPQGEACALPGEDAGELTVHGMDAGQLEIVAVSSGGDPEQQRDA